MRKSQLEETFNKVPKLSSRKRYLNECKIWMNGLFNSTHSGIIFYDNNFQIIDFNQEALKLLGIKCDDIKKQYATSLDSDPNVSPQIINEIQHNSKTVNYIEYNFDLPRKDIFNWSSHNGKVIFEMHSSKLCTDNGEQLGFIIQFEDVTQKLLQEQRFNEIEKAFRSLMDVGKSVVWKYSINNDLFEPVLGKIYGKGKIRLQDGVNMVKDEDKEAYLMAFKKLINGTQKSITGTYHFVIPEEDCDAYFRIEMTAWVNTRTKEEYIFATQRDITEDVIQRIELEQFKKRIELTSVAAGILQWEYDLQTKKIIIVAGKTVIQNRDIDIEKYISYIHPDDRQNVINKIIELQERELEDKDMHIEYRLKLPGVNEYRSQVLDGVKIYDDNSKCTKYIGFRRDVTEWTKKNDELTLAKKKAEESDALKSTFLANMSHEIRTPLNAIVGFSDLLCVTQKQNEREQYIKLIASNSDILLRLVGDILDLSKIESGIIDMIYEKFDLSEVFNELYKTFKQKMGDSDVELIKDNPYSECIVNLDKNRLIQVITNFLTNSIKYTPIGYIKMWYRYENGGVKVYVKDTGIGISKEKHDKVFTRFEKLDEFAQGTGLGLSICKAIADVKHGNIGFTSEESKGSTFWIWLPTEAEIDCGQKHNTVIHSCNTESKVEQTDKQNSLNILVAEDNDSNYLLIKSILKQYNLTRAVNGKEAVELAHNNKYDLIFMDIKMPVMDGLEATRLIREFNKDIQIIALTANAFDTDRKAAMKSGCSAFMTKPIRLNELQSIINSFS